MKYLVLLCDGMADTPVPELGFKTPMEAALKPNMDKLAREGRLGLARQRCGQSFGSGVPPGGVLYRAFPLGSGQHGR